MNLISQYTEGSDLSDLQKLYDAQCDGQNTKLLELCRSIQRPKISQLDLDDEHAIFSYIAHENLCSIVT